MKPIMLITVALGCGLVAAVGVYQQMGKAGAATEIEKVDVVVAKTEISINEALTAENIELVQWAQDQLLPGTATTLEELEGMYARARLYPGEAVLKEKIMDGTEASRSVLVPKGYRVVSVEVELDSSVSNLIEPGDRVDVLVVIADFRTNVYLAKTILSAVRVFAVNSNIAPTKEVDEAPVEAKAVSLILKPDQAEKLMMGTEMGTIKLSLRSPDDADAEDTIGCTFDQVIGRKTDVADEVTDGEVDLNRGGAERPSEDASAKMPAYWSMVVFSPTSAQQFSWAAQGSVPQREVLYSDDSSSTKDDDTAEEKKAGKKGGKDGDMDFDELDDDVAVSDYSNADE